MRHPRHLPEAVPFALVAFQRACELVDALGAAGFDAKADDGWPFAIRARPPSAKASIGRPLYRSHGARCAPRWQSPTERWQRSGPTTVFGHLRAKHAVSPGGLSESHLVNAFNFCIILRNTSRR
jgi:hypothetical protein